MIQILKNQEKSKTYKWWFVLMLVSLLGIALFHTIQFDSTLFEESKKDPRKFDQEKFYIYFYFTFQSNFLSFLLSGLVVLGVFKKDNIHSQRMKVVTFISLLITMLVFWTYLFPNKLSNGDEYSTMGFINTFILHTITPLLFIFTFLYEVKKEKIISKLKFKKDFLIIIIYPLIWFLMSIIVYFSYGGGPEDAIYPFLKFKSQNIIISIVFPIGIALMFLIFLALILYIFNKWSFVNDENKEGGLK